MHPRAAAQDGVSSIRRPFSRTTQPALRNGIPIRSPPASTPPAPPAGRLPTRFCRGTPTPPAPSARDTHTLLPAAPTPPAPSQKDTHTLLPTSPTPPAPSALRPCPQRGAGSVRGDIRGAAVSGLEPAGSRARFFSGISPCAGPWRYRHGGRGRRGGGTRSPSPVSHTPTILLLAGPHPTRASCRQATHPPLGTPTPPAPSALLPRPQRGAGAVRGDIRGATVPGAMPGGQPCSGLLRDLPMPWTVWISPRREAARGEGERVPPPLSLTLQTPFFSAATSRPARVGQSDTHDGSGQAVPERTSGVYSRQR